MLSAPIFAKAVVTEPTMFQNSKPQKCSGNMSKIPVGPWFLYTRLTDNQWIVCEDGGGKTTTREEEKTDKTVVRIPLLFT